MIEQIKKLKQSGLSIRQIADKLGISKGKVEWVLKQQDSEQDKTTGQDTQQDSKAEHKKIKINSDGSYYDENGVYRLSNGRTIGEDIFIFD